MMAALLVRACIAATAAATAAQAALSLSDGKLSLVDSALAQALAYTTQVPLLPRTPTHALTLCAQPASPRTPQTPSPLAT